MAHPIPEHDALINQNWKDFAGRAFDRFKKKGPGAWMLDAKAAAGKDPAVYVSLAELDQDVAAAGSLALLRRYINEYNPELEVVFCFAVNEGAKVYRVGGVPTPKEALEQLLSE